MKCVRCGNEFAADDDVTFYPTGLPDDDWRKEGAGRCCRCFLEFTYEMYGGAMAPRVTMGDRIGDAE